jgi:hypothetical protein
MGTDGRADEKKHFPSAARKENQFSLEKKVPSFSSQFLRSLASASTPARPAVAMHKTAQAWFTGGTAASSGAAAESQPSLLADWNSYAATRSDASSSSPLPFDIEAAVRSANDTVSGTLSS